MRKPSITIRIGAAYDLVTVDKVVFDRSKMDRPAKRKLTRLLVDALRVTR